VEKIAARSVGAVAVDPVLLAQLGLVLVLLAGVAHLVAAMGELALMAVQAGAFLLEIAADFRLEARIGGVVNGAGAEGALPFVLLITAAAVIAVAVITAAAN